MTKGLNKLLLDYDGFVCKAFYAAKEYRDADPDINKVFEILNTLDNAAIQKGLDYFGDNIIVKRYMSRHSIKKDLFPTYKAKRKKNELLGQVRNMVLNSNDKPIISMDGYEADDLIITETTVNEPYIIFSDDKDILNNGHTFCKINLTEQIQTQTQEESDRKIAIQYLMGDKEDNIDGIPKVGKITATKIIDNMPEITFKNIIKVYKDHNVSFEETSKNLFLLRPLFVDEDIRDVLAFIYGTTAGVFCLNEKTN